MNITTPPHGRPTAKKGPMDLYVKRHPIPSNSSYGLGTPPLQHVHEHPKTNTVSKFGWVAINASPEVEDQYGDHEDDKDYDMDIDEDNPSAEEEEYLKEDFEEELEDYTYQDHEFQEEEEEEITELDGKPNHLLKIFGSHSHTILTASNTAPLLTAQECNLMTQIKSRKDEANFCYPSGSHSYHPYLGPSILRNASLDRLGQFLNGPELEKIKIDLVRWPDKKDWRRVKAGVLWRMLYVRAIREKETEGTTRGFEKQKKEREELRENGVKIIAVKSGLFAGYNVQDMEEEELSWDEMLRTELEMKTKRLDPVERREWLRRVYGARWTWYAMKFGLHVELDEGDVVVRS